MNNLTTIVVLNIFLVFNVFGEYRSNAISFGPMLHMNIGDEMKLSISFELSYWQLKDTPYPWSVDIGIEYGADIQRIYSELQTGVYYAGVSSGVAVEYNKGDIAYGYQGSIWGNLFAGFDFRYRRIRNENYFCPGFYVKAPVFLDGINGN